MAESMQNVHTNVGSMWEKAPRSLRNNQEKYYGISWMLFISMEGSFSCNTMHTISTFLYLVLLSLKSYHLKAKKSKKHDPQSRWRSPYLFTRVAKHNRPQIGKNCCPQTVYHIISSYACRLFAQHSM
jgi:hypothetical protein